MIVSGGLPEPRPTPVTTILGVTTVTDGVIREWTWHQFVLAHPHPVFNLLPSPDES